MSGNIAKELMNQIAVMGSGNYVVLCPSYQLVQKIVIPALMREWGTFATFRGKKTIHLPHIKARVLLFSEKEPYQKVIGLKIKGGVLVYADYEHFSRMTNRERGNSIKIDQIIKDSCTRNGGGSESMNIDDITKYLSTLSRKL